MKVLVADDDLVSRLMVQSAVESLGHDCLSAADGEQAWQALSYFHADVVITDWMMPGMDGLELCRRIRANDIGAYTYVILVTSLGERDNVLSGMEAGADDYLAKPLEPFDLETRLIAARRVTTLHAELARYRGELARLACTDPLTQLRNRLSLADDLAAVHARSQRYGRRYAMAMCDVDFFKGYNDTDGHQAGDATLRAVAESLAKQTREGDGCYRYGGEEFLLVLLEQTLPAAGVAAERARRAVGNLALDYPATPAGMVTISIGVAAFEPGDDVKPEDVLEQADVALYQAKATGRNKVVLAHTG